MSDASQLLERALRRAEGVDLDALRELGRLLDSIKTQYGVLPDDPLFHRIDAGRYETRHSLDVLGNLFVWSSLLGMGDISAVNLGLSGNASILGNLLVGGTINGTLAAPSARVYADANQAIPNNLGAELEFNQERWDTDAQHEDTVTTLTGTVAANSGAAGLTGTGTSFTTELYVGMRIRINLAGTPQTRWVTAITNNTSATVSPTWGSTVSGVTYGRVNNPRLTCKAAGKYLVVGNAHFASNGTGIRQLTIVRHSGGGIASVVIARQRQPSGAADTYTLTTTTIADLALNDVLTLRVAQTSGGVLNIETDASHEVTPEFMMTRIG